MRQPAVSIIIPAFNEEKALPLCLGSLSSLDWPVTDREVILVDNGSTDRTCEIAGSFGARVIRDDTATVAGLRNLGAEQARGRILAFIDADCTAAPDWLKRSSVYFDTPGIIAWGGPPEVPCDGTWVQKAWYVLRQKERRVMTVDWLESMNFFVGKKAFLRVGGFDRNLVTCEDVDLSYRLSGFGDIVADRSIRVIHLGEADTLRVFIRKELWRGRDNFKGALVHGFSIKELPSLGIPVYFGVYLPLAWSGAAAAGSAAGWAAVFVSLMLPGFGVLIKTRKKKAGVLRKIQLLVLSYLYFVVRTLAVLPVGKKGKT